MSDKDSLISEKGYTSLECGHQEHAHSCSRHASNKCQKSVYRKKPTKWCCRSRKMVIISTSVISISLFLSLQCLFWNISPLMRACCMGSESHPVVDVIPIGDNHTPINSQAQKSREEEIEFRKSKQTRRHGKGKGRKGRKKNFDLYDDFASQSGDAKQRLPQCLIIGVRKGGTRALLEFLSLHPNIRAHRAEIHFFNDEQNYALGLEWYRTNMPFSGPDQITIEKTPAYFVSESVPDRVHEMNESIKLLLIVRDPVERAISDYDQIREQRQRHGKEEIPFESLAINEETGRINEKYNAIRRSIYHRFMARWLRLFPREQFHLVSGEMLVKNPVPELKKVEKFLGLPLRLSEDQFYLNKTKGFYCMRDTSGMGQERCLAPSKGRQHPYVSKDVIDKLRKYFKPHNERFYSLVGVDFGWPN